MFSTPVTAFSALTSDRQPQVWVTFHQTKSAVVRYITNTVFIHTHTHTHTSRVEASGTLFQCAVCVTIYLQAGTSPSTSRRRGPETENTEADYRKTREVQMRKNHGKGIIYPPFPTCRDNCYCFYHHRFHI